MRRKGLVAGVKRGREKGRLREGEEAEQWMDRDAKNACPMRGRGVHRVCEEREGVNCAKEGRIKIAECGLVCGELLDTGAQQKRSALLVVA